MIRAVARVGGGALPLLELHGPAVALDPGPAGADALAAALRAGDPPLVGRIQDDRLLLDPRTLDDAEVDLAAQAVADALRERRSVTRFGTAAPLGSRIVRVWVDMTAPAHPLVLRPVIERLRAAGTRGPGDGARLRPDVGDPRPARRSRTSRSARTAARLGAASCGRWVTGRGG